MIEVQRLKNGISFRISGPLLQQIYDWEVSIDEKVFKEQLATGSYKGRYKVDKDMLLVMKMVEKEGKVLPYYGVGGSRGSCVYGFRLIDTKCLLTVRNTLTEDVFELELTTIKSEKAVQREQLPKLKFSILPVFADKDPPEAWSGEPNKHLECKIVSKEYQNLGVWKNWIEKRAFTPKYIYRFGQVSLGATGLTVTIEDTETGDIFDATDYDSW